MTFYTPAKGLMVALALLGGAACSRAGDGKASAQTTGSTSALKEARARFLAVPAAVPGIVGDIAAAFPTHAPLARDTALLTAAARTGYSAATFDRASAAVAAPDKPNPATAAAIERLAQAETKVSSDAATGESHDDADKLAPLLPSVAAAGEQGLALDRIHLLCEATRANPDVVRATTPSVLASDGSDFTTYSRDNIEHEDQIWGGAQRREVAAATARAAGALRSLTPADVALISRWYAGPGGRAEIARQTAVLTRAYDAAAVATTKDYYRRLQTDRAAPAKS